MTQTLIVVALSTLCGATGLRIAEDDPRPAHRIVFAVVFTLGLMMPVTLLLLAGD